MNKEINEIINNLEQALGWCDRITTGNLPHKIGNLKQCLVSTIELLKVLNLGWRPASELPKEGELVLVFGKIEKSIGAFGAIFSNGGYYVESVLNDPDIVNNHIPIKDVKWWCYPPKED